MAILTATTRLLSVFTFDIGNFRANRFTVSNLRFTYVSFYLEFTEKTVNDDFKMELAHT